MGWYLSLAMIDVLENLPSLREPEGVFWEQGFLDGEQFAQLKSIRIAEKSCFGDKKKAIYLLSQFGTISAHLMEHLGDAVLMWLRQVFHVNRFPVPALEKGKMIPEIFGQTLLGLFVKWDQDSVYWKTCLPYDALTGKVYKRKNPTLGKYLATWPKRGTMRNGVCWERTTLGHHTDASGSGFWPTPRARDWKGKGKDCLPSVVGGNKTQQTYPTPSVCGNYNRKGASKTSGNGLATAIKMKELNFQESTSANQKGQQGPLNPDWVEWLMGWPIGWTDLKPLAMARSQAVWLRLSSCWLKELTDE